MTRSPKLIGQLLKDWPLLRQIDREISAQSQLLKAIQRHLPADLASHCVAARLVDERLILHTDSPVWASRLRFLSGQLVILLQNDFPALRNVKIKLRPKEQTRTPRKHAPRLSAAGADAVISTAAHTTSAPLKHALERLGRRLRGQDPSS